MTLVDDTTRNGRFSIEVDAAERQIDSLIDRLESGDLSEVILTRGEVPVARLLPGVDKTSESDG